MTVESRSGTVEPPRVNAEPPDWRRTSGSIPGALWNSIKELDFSPSGPLGRELAFGDHPTLQSDQALTKIQNGIIVGTGATLVSIATGGAATAYFGSAFAASASGTIGIGAMEGLAFSAAWNSAAPGWGLNPFTTEEVVWNTMGGGAFASVFRLARVAGAAWGTAEAAGELGPRLQGAFRGAFSSEGARMSGGINEQGWIKGWQDGVVPEGGAPAKAGVAGAAEGLSGKIGYPADDLSAYALRYRTEILGPEFGGNVAAFEYENAGGELVKEIATSEGINGWHSERIILERLRNLGLNPATALKRVFSEFAPCQNPGSYCAARLAREAPLAKVSYAYEYGGPPIPNTRAAAAERAASRARGVQARDEHFQLLFGEGK